MGLLVFTWASVLRHCLLPQTVEAQGTPEEDYANLLKFRDNNIQTESAIWDTWNEKDTNSCHWIGVSCTPDSLVQGLHFSGWGLESINIQGLDALTSLQELDLSSNKFSTVPDVSGLSRLTRLDLSGNKHKQAPKPNTTDSEPGYDVWNMSSVNFNSLVSLQYLNLAGSNIAGSWPTSWDGLVELQFLFLSDNQLGGSIPDLKKLSNLVSLDVSDNKLTGGIPNVEGLSTQLIHLSLANNQLTGEVPNMEALTSLSNLYLSGNLLTGFNESGFRSNSLRDVDISKNKLEGRIPDGVGQMPNLQTLDLSWNTLGGPLPSGLGRVSRLDLSHNMLSGDIPDDIRIPPADMSQPLLTMVVYLNDNQLTGSIPTSLLDAECMNLDLSRNFLQGNISGPGFGGFLRALDLSDNLLDGPFPLSSSFLFLSLGGNRLFGDIIEHLSMILTTHTWQSRIGLDNRLPGNLFTGDIAALCASLAQSSAFDNTQFSVLDLRNNGLHMALPTGEDSNPVQAMLEDPHMDFLVVLMLAGNSLKGISLPQTLNWSLPLLILDLSDTSLEGEVSGELFTSLGSLTNFSVSMNNLSGTIPAKLSLLTNLQVLDIGENRLEGEIDDEIFTNLSSLLVFSARNNMFFGPIPAKLPAGLQVLDLSGNKFSGGIPADLFTRLPNLTFFNVSNNNLSGPIPGGLPPNVSTAASFANNPGLCGYPLPPCLPEPGRRRSRTWVVIMAVLVPTAFLVSLTSCLLLAWKWRSYSKQHKQDAGLIEILGKRTLALTVMPIEDLRRATKNFSASSKIGEGGGGIVYKGKLKNGTDVAVKTSKDRDKRGGLFAVDRQQFLTEVEILSRVHHRHLVKLLGCSMQSKKAALVYEYVPNGTLEDHLRGKMERLLSWKQRLLIALQTSEALAYLHYAADPPIIHTDVKPSNILLDDDLTVKVADFGISTLAPMGPATYVETDGVQGTFGYMDPEYHQTSQLTAKSDVYSFGAVLLQLISATSPRDILRGGREASLEHVAHSVMESGDWESLIDHCLQNTLDIATGKASIHSTCALAADCLAMTSAKRPEMKEVRKQLQILWVQYLATCNHGEDLQSDIQEPEGIQAPEGAQDHSPLLDLDYCTFTPSSTSTGTHSGSTGASRSGIEVVT